MDNRIKAVFVGQSIVGRQRFSLPSEIQALRGSCVVLPCTSSIVFQNSLPTQNFKWCLWRGAGYPEVYNNVNSKTVEPQFKGRTFFVGNLEQNNCSLQINNVTKGDADHYYPLIDEKFDNYIQVKVSDFPEEVALSLPGKMTEGLPVMINCSVVHTCPPHPPTLTWDHLKGKTRVYHEDLQDGRWRAVLTLNYTPTEEDHTKPVTCSAVHSNGIMSHETKFFSIRYAPKSVTVVDHTATGTILEGGTVTLHCSCEAYPFCMNYTWFEGLQKVLLQSEDKSTITVRNISWDSGPYMCTAQNEVGKGESPLLALDIKYAPKGVRIASENHVTEGDNLDLSCETKSSNPAVMYYTWYRNHTEVGKLTEKMLIIEHITKNHSGYYQCVAHNQIGNGSSEAVHIIVNDAEASVSIFFILSVSAVVIIILLALVVFIFIRNRRKRLLLQAKDKHSHSASEHNQHNGTSEEIPMKDHLYGNIQEYLNVKDQYPDSSSSKHPDPTAHEDMNTEIVYSQVNRPHRQEQVSPEETHYSIIIQFPRHATPHAATQTDDSVEYAAVQR